VKTRHRHLVGLLKTFIILEWKWEVVTVNFIANFPRIMKKHDSIMVVVDKLTKETHFIPVKTTHKEANIAEVYMKQIVRLHGVPNVIVSDRDQKLTSNFWKGLFKRFGTNINLSTMYHPESDGKIERTNRIIVGLLKY
jgi:hypothetical protein